MSVKYRWWCLSDNETAADGREIVAREYELPRDIAESAADADYYNGANEADWPRRYAIQATEGKNRKVRIFDVDRKFDPTFRASAVKRCEAPDCKRLADDGTRCRPCYKVWVDSYFAAIPKEPTP